MDLMKIADPDAVHSVRSFIRKQLASELKEELLNTVKYLLFPVWIAVYLSFYVLLFIYNMLQVKNNRSSEEYKFDHLNMSRRALKNTALGLSTFKCSLFFAGCSKL